MSTDPRDDLYRLATLLAEIDRVLHPLDRAGLGKARVAPAIPPPLPPTGVPGPTPGGAPSGPTRRGAARSARQPQPPPGERGAIAPAGGHPPPDRPWVDPPPAGRVAEGPGPSPRAIQAAGTHPPPARRPAPPHAPTAAAPADAAATPDPTRQRPPQAGMPAGTGGHRPPVEAAPPGGRQQDAMPPLPDTWPGTAVQIPGPPSPIRRAAGSARSQPQADAHAAGDPGVRPAPAGATEPPAAARAPGPPDRPARPSTRPPAPPRPPSPTDAVQREPDAANRLPPPLPPSGARSARPPAPPPGLAPPRRPTPASADPPRAAIPPGAPYPTAPHRRPQAASLPLTTGRWVDLAIDGPPAAADRPPVHAPPAPPEPEDDALTESWDDGAGPAPRILRLNGRAIGTLDTARLAGLDVRLKRRFLDRAVRRLS